MRKPTVLWVDLTLATQESELPALFSGEFNILPVIDASTVGTVIKESQACAVCFDFDYPDARRLNQLVNLKTTFPSIPVIMMTLQHSE